MQQRIPEELWAEVADWLPANEIARMSMTCKRAAPLMRPLQVQMAEYNLLDFKGGIKLAVARRHMSWLWYFSGLVSPKVAIKYCVLAGDNYTAQQYAKLTQKGRSYILHAAALVNDKSLMYSIATPDTILNEDRIHVLRNAARNGHADIIKEYMNESWLNEEHTLYRADIFLAAARGGHEDIINQFMINDEPEYGRAFIYTATTHGHVELVRKYIDRVELNVDDCALLITAVYSVGNHKLFEEHSHLLPLIDWRICLDQAIHDRRFDLVQQAAKMCSYDISGLDVLAALARGPIEITKFLLQCCHIDTVWLGYIECQNAEVLRYLINHRVIRARKALEVAVRTECVGIIRYLAGSVPITRQILKAGRKGSSYICELLLKLRAAQWKRKQHRNRRGF